MTRMAGPAVVAAALLMMSCSAAEPPLAATTDAARAVAVARVERQDLSRTVEVAAEFRPYQEIAVHAKVAGYVKAIHVDIGDQVAKGQLLAELEAPEVTQDLQQADATLNRARVDVDRAKSDLRRADAQASIRKVSFDRLASVLKVRANLVAQQEIDDARARLEDADAQRAAADAAVHSAEDQVQAATAARDRLQTMVAYLRITAPFSGTITRRLADTGAMIQAGTASNVQAMPVVELSEMDRLRLILPVPESIVPRIRVEAPVEVRVDALKRVFQGRVTRFSGKLDPATRTMETEVDLANPGNTIKAGMFGTATLGLEQRQDVLTVPVQALAGRTAPVTVLVAGPDKRLQEKSIEIGLETPDRVEVRSGLAAGDLVVVGARTNLRAGQRIDPKVQTTERSGEPR
jgi:multidrug efflux pump subunit AcrA (membrane-fusion protein)